MTVARARIAARPVEFFADGLRRVADVEICGCWEKATKPIKVQSALIALLIFDLRVRWYVWSIATCGRERILCYCDEMVPTIGSPNSLLISSGFVGFERIGRRLYRDTRARNQRQSFILSTYHRSHPRIADNAIWLKCHFQGCSNVRLWWFHKELISV